MTEIHKEKTMNLDRWGLKWRNPTREEEGGCRPAIGEPVVALRGIDLSVEARGVGRANHNQFVRLYSGDLHDVPLDYVPLLNLPDAYLPLSGVEVEHLKEELAQLREVIALRARAQAAIDAANATVDAQSGHKDLITKHESEQLGEVIALMVKAQATIDAANADAPCGATAHLNAGKVGASTTRYSAGKVGPSTTRYKVVCAHDHATLKVGDVVVMTEDRTRANWLLREADLTLHDLTDEHSQYIHLEKLAETAPSTETQRRTG